MPLLEQYYMALLLLWFIGIVLYLGQGLAPMPMPFKIFASSLAKHWWALMGCAVFTLLGMYIAVSNKSNAYLVAASAFLAVVFFVIASYRTWKEEYDKYHSELERNARPDIRGYISDVKIFPMKNRCKSSVSFEISICNHSPANTNCTQVLVSTDAGGVINVARATVSMTEIETLVSGTRGPLLTTDLGHGYSTKRKTIDIADVTLLRGITHTFKGSCYLSIVFTTEPKLVFKAVDYAGEYQLQIVGDQEFYDD